MNGCRVATVVVGVVLCPVLAQAQVPPTCSSGPTETVRWHVPRVEHHDVSGALFGQNYCETTLLVANLSRTEALVQVDFQAPGNNQCIQDEIATGGSLAFATAPMTPIQNAFFPGLGWGSPGSVVGRANVHSDQRDVHVSVYLVCRDAPVSSPGNVVAITQLSAIQLR